MKRFAILAFTATLAFAAPSDAAPLPVIASFSILGDMVSEIGGDAVAVTTLVGPDSDTHTYQPTPDDAKAIARADLIFINGLGFEGWIQRLIDASGTKGKTVIVSTGVKPRTMTNDGKEITDPHAWQNLANGHLYIKNIAAALSAAIPGDAAAIARRAAAFDAAVTRKDDETRKAIAAIPAGQRKIITSHDAFGYFGAAYGVTFMAPVGIDTEAAASAQDVGKLILQIKAQHVHDVFIENMSDPRLIASIAGDAGAAMGGTLYSDALSPADGPAPTYLAMFDNNVPKLTAAMRRNGQ